MTIHRNSKMQSETARGVQELISIEAAAAQLGLSPWTLRRWVCNRRITTCKLGTRRLIPVSEITRLISDGMETRDE